MSRAAPQHNAGPFQVDLKFWTIACAWNKCRGKGGTMKKFTQFTLIAMLLLPFVPSCQTTISDTTVQIPTVESPQDQALSNSVRNRLLADKKIDLSGVNVVSNNGTVYLSGTVSSLDARQQALKIAWEVGGVQSVVNSLEVQK
jgi:hypothetical protein